MMHPWGSLWLLLRTHCLHSFLLSQTVYVQTGPPDLFTSLIKQLPKHTYSPCSFEVGGGGWTAPVETYLFLEFTLLVSDTMSLSQVRARHTDSSNNGGSRPAKENLAYSTLALCVHYYMSS